jgi:hypothetical protein
MPTPSGGRFADELESTGAVRVSFAFIAYPSICERSNGGISDVGKDVFRKDSPMDLSGARSPNRAGFVSRLIMLSAFEISIIC